MEAGNCSDGPIYTEQTFECWTPPMSLMLRESKRKQTASRCPSDPLKSKGTQCPNRDIFEILDILRFRILEILELSEIWNFRGFVAPHTMYNDVAVRCPQNMVFQRVSEAVKTNSENVGTVCYRQRAPSVWSGLECKNTLYIALSLCGHSVGTLWAL